MVIPKSWLVLLFFLLTPLSTFAQKALPSNSESFLRVTSAYSPQSIILLGKTPESQTFALQLNYGWKSKWSLKSNPILYLVSVTPYINYDYPKRDEGSKRDVVTGLGVSPIGFEIQKDLIKRLRFIINTSGGFILVDKTFPTDKGRRLNYTFSVSTALIFQTNQTLSFLLGYKFHHISNAQTGSENPGIDSNFIFFSTQLSL